MTASRWVEDRGHTIFLYLAHHGVWVPAREIAFWVDSYGSA